MKIAGIIAGVGPESTIEYYRQIIDLYRKQQDDGSYPAVILNSINMTKMLDLIGSGRLEEVTGYLLEEIRRLALTGADFGALSSNTPHIVFDALRQQSPIPLISIVETACQAAQTLGLKRVGLFGTRFTMQGRFYPDVFECAGISVLTPAPEEQAYIHEKYMGELVNGILLPETRESLLKIVRRMKAQDHLEGLVLGGTELPLILKNVQDEGIHFLDTTQLHVAQIVAAIRS